MTKQIQYALCDTCDMSFPAEVDPKNGGLQARYEMAIMVPRGVGRPASGAILWCSPGCRNVSVDPGILTYRRNFPEHSDVAVDVHMVPRGMAMRTAINRWGFGHYFQSDDEIAFTAPHVNACGYARYNGFVCDEHDDFCPLYGKPEPDYRAVEYHDRKPLEPLFDESVYSTWTML